MGNVKQIESGQKDKDLREILINIHMDYINKQRFMEKSMVFLIKILIQPFQFISYLEVSVYKAIGEHGSIKVKGIIDATLADEYFAMMEKDVWVKVILNNESVNTIFFQGIATNLYI